MRRKVSLFVLVAVAALAAGLTAATAARTADPGVSAKSITIGGTFPFSGPASLYSPIGKSEAAYYAYVNSQGGVNGRKINYITQDDGYNPATTVQLTRKLVEQNKVFAIVGSLGTEPTLAARPYLNQQKVPQVLVSTGASFWGSDYRKYPWTIGFQPNYIAEGYVYGKFIVDKVPQAKIGILYQNDAYGKDYIAGLKKGLGEQQDKIVDSEGYEVTTANVAAQVAKLKASGANVFAVFATPNFAVQALVIAYKLGWHPTIFLNSVSATNTLMGLAAKSSAPEAVTGIISAQYLMDPADPKYAKPAGLALYKQIMSKFDPSGDPNDTFNVYGMAAGWTFVEALKAAGKNPTRQALMNALLSLNTKDNPFLLPGMTIKTTKTDHFPLDQAVLIRFNNGHFSPFGHLFTYLRTG
jgi:ABC-type branched-subunit amino acid transport system substrate-binding protein